MSDPFSGIPDPGTPRPIRKPSRPSPAQEALRDVQEALRARLPRVKAALQKAQRAAKESNRRAQRYGQDLWLRGKRDPRKLGLVGGAVALTLVGAYALSASVEGRSLCPPASAGKTSKFQVFLDSVPHVAAGSAVKIHYDVCGLASGAAYRGKVRLVQQQRTAGKKKSARPKPLVISFKDRVDGIATRRQQQLNLVSTKPGAYTLELSVTDRKGRERKRVQKILIKAP